MIFYKATKTSLDIEAKITLGEIGFQNLEACRKYSDLDENIYKITITVEQIEPKL